MRTAIFVYKTTSIHISNCEGDLELCGMNAAAVSLPAGDHDRTIEPGIYKILSSHDVKVTGDSSAIEVVTTNRKDNDPKPPPLRATETFAPLDLDALTIFMTAPDAKVVANP